MFPSLLKTIKMVKKQQMPFSGNICRDQGSDNTLVIHRHPLMEKHILSATVYGSGNDTKSNCFSSFDKTPCQGAERTIKVTTLEFIPLFNTINTIKLAQCVVQW